MVQHEKTKTTIKMLLFVPMLLGILLLCPSPVTAQNSVWTWVGSAAVPDESSLDKYEAIGGQFRHKGTNTGSIYARCNVINPRDDGQDPDWGLLEAVFRDPTGTGNQVKIQLIRVSNSTGGTYTIATLDSNKFTASDDFQTKSIPFNYNFNFFSYAYYVLITVTRTSSGAGNNPACAIVRLTVPGPE